MSPLLLLEIEVSSHSLTDSYPIEAAWLQIDPDTGEPLDELESVLIRPAPGWTDWSPEHERAHRIRRELIEKRGKPTSVVALRLLAAARACDAVVVSSSPWVEGSLRRLLEAAVLDPYAIRVETVPRALSRVAGLPMPLAAQLVAEITPYLPRLKHRAGADLLRSRALWQLCLEARWSIEQAGL